MRNLKDQRTNIFPSTTRGGKELPSSSALDSCYILNKLATPTPAIDSDMSHVIDDATSATNVATTLLDKTVPLGELLDEHLARVRTIDYAEDDDISETDEIVETENFETPDKTSSHRYELPVIPEGYVMDGEVARDFLTCKDREDLEKLLCKLKGKSLNARMKHDPKFGTSLIFIADKDFMNSVSRQS